MSDSSRLRLLDQSDRHRPWLSADGTWPHQIDHAGCDCGWSGPRRPHSTTSADQIRHDLHNHLDQIGLDRPTMLDDDQAHTRCGYRHHQQDDCLIPPGSPSGLLARAVTSGLSEPERALDRIRAITALRSWLDEMEPQALIGAAINQTSWAQIADAAGIDADDAKTRWGRQLERYILAGVLPPIGDQ